MKKRKLIRAVAAMLAFSSLFTYAAGCKSKNDTENDGEDKPTEEELAYMKGHDQYLDHILKTDTENAYYLISSGSLGDYEDAKLSPNTTVKAEGASASGKWEDQIASPNLKFPNVPKDISSFNTLIINVYSETANQSSFTLCINCQPSSDNGTPKTAYKKYTGRVDFTGWKQFCIPLTDMENAYSPDITRVSSIIWNANGWSNTPQADTKLYFDSAYFANTSYEFSMDIDTLGDYNYDHITNTFVKFLIGEASLSEADENTKPQLESYIKQGKTAMESMSNSGDPWNYDMQTTAGITGQYSRILQMALLYAIEGSEYYHSSALLSKIRSAMTYMHNNYYSDKALKTYPKRNNWWDWQIGSAQHIVNILMLCKDGLGDALTDKFLEPVNKYVPLPSLTMANLVDLAYVTVAASALQHDAARLVASRAKLDDCMGYVKRGDGFYHDGSFIQHDIIPYTGSYGPILLEALSKIVLAVDDTCFRVKEELIEEQYKWAVDSFVPLMYHGAFYGLVRGRSICRTSTDVSLGCAAFKGMMRMTYYAGAERAAVLKGILKEYIEYNDAYYISALTPYDQQLYKALKADTSVTARTDREFVKMFALMDRAIASLPDYGVGISLSSSRIAKYEAINEENGKGWYTGDGMLYIYTGVDDYEPEYWKNVNYYRIPGTTVTTVPRADRNINAQKTLSKYNFVGGSYLDRSMAVAMQFESAPSGMKEYDFTSSLNGKKAWFIFDNEIVCLGTGINSNDNYNTETILENRRLPMTESFYSNGAAVTDQSGTLSGCSSIWFSSLGGIYLPQPADVSFNRSEGKVSFLELYIDHGKTVKNGSYSYVMLPTMTKAESDAYCAAPETEILSNTEKVQAARDISSGTEGYIFWDSGSFNGIEVSGACSVLINGKTVAVSDPSMKLPSLTVKVNGQSFTVEPKDGQTYTFSLS